VQKRRDARKAKQEAAKPADEKALLFAADDDEAQEAAAVVRRPNIVSRAKTTGSDMPVTAIKKTGFAKMFGAQQHQQEASNFLDYEDQQPVVIGSRRLAIWPYDDFHLIQKLFYETLQNEESKEHPSDHVIMQQNSSMPIFSRPKDPSDIPTAVQGLSLTEFEIKAEERAISIVSCWLFDAGLIDELLVNGGMSLEEEDDKTQQGIEVGHAGFPIEGSSKMDKEIAKLGNATHRQLALINARLNDGVAATGAEVQELVNAVICTKEDIGRLRELSTYVSNAGDVDQANTFMLTKYPKLKQAINARRNLARCFRELDFFSQIPTTCDRLREELQSCEWTAHEWSTLRSVCREHVELEIFLVEAEAGMKKVQYF
jgi:hypothetical protein